MFLPSQQAVVTAGEDGALSVLQLADLARSRRPPPSLRRVAFGNGALYSMTGGFITPGGRNQTKPIVVTAGASPSAQLQIWDLTRTPGKGGKPELWLKDSTPGAVHLCVAGHPTQPQQFATGSSAGDVCLWDVRVGRCH